MAQRVLAVLGAVGLVLAAIVVRSAIDDDGNDSGNNADGEVVLVCTSDLAAACAQLDGVRIIEQDAASTAAGIAEQAEALDGVDGWLTTSAWVEVVDSRAPGRLGDSLLIATSPVVVAVDPSRAEAVTALCQGESIWACLGTNAGAGWGGLGSGQASWGTLRTGLPSANAAIGLPVIAAAASGFFGGTDFASNDFDATGFRDWLAGFTEPSGKGEHMPITRLVTARGTYTAVGDVAAAAANRRRAVVGDPGVAATVVLVELPGGDRLSGADSMRDALVAAGWTAASGDAPPAILKPGVMAALHTLWTEVTR